jgi:hypothetical protein
VDLAEARYRRAMAPPKRRAKPGSAAAIREDLVFARDAGGLDRAGIDRLAATIGLVGHADPANALEAARELLAAHTERVCLLYEQLNVEEPCAVAAARSVRAILLQPFGASLPAAIARRQALQDVGCYMLPDSLRKREGPVLALIASSALQQLQERPPRQLPAPEALLERMAPIADLLREAMEATVETLVLQDELDDASAIPRLLDYTLWSLGELLVWPRATYEALRALPERPFEYWVLEQECLSLLILPFEAEPEDSVALLKAWQASESHDGFYSALATVPDTAAMAGRLVGWLSSCTTDCAFHRSFRLLNMCPPHRYVALLDDFVDAVGHLRSGVYGRELQQLLGPLFSDGSSEKNHGAASADVS